MAPVRKLSVRDLDLDDRRVLVRVDFNVPIANGRVSDDTRLKASLPTLRHILDHGGKLILLSHLGRPNGKVDPQLTLAPAAVRLQELLGHPVLFLNECLGPRVESTVREMKSGDILLLENVRFHSEEEWNDEGFARRLAALGDVYVNDAFGTAHRAHASTAGIARYVRPSAMGFLMERELKYLGMVLERPEKPFVAILGGAKVSDKILVLEKLISKMDVLLIGGGMAYTFLAAQGKPIGKSLVEMDKIDVAQKILSRARVVLPMDHVILHGDMTVGEVLVPSVVEVIPDSAAALDIGPHTVMSFKRELTHAKTVLWNGPLGVFETPAFENGTRSIATILAEGTATTIVGGGDTAAAVGKFGLADKMTHVSTGGGASLEFLEGGSLPGVAALSDTD